MIRYALTCDKAHSFESWFADSSAYSRIPSLQHGRRFELVEPLAEPTHLHVVGNAE
jgi:hypothetical protein